MEGVLDVAERVRVAWESGDYRTLRTLLHPEGSWVLVKAGPRTFSDPDQLVEALRVARETTSYRIYSLTQELLGRNVVLASGYIRTPVADSFTGHMLGRHFFLLEFRDDLLYRRERFLSEREARRAYEAGWGSNATSSATQRTAQSSSPGASKARHRSRRSSPASAARSTARVAIGSGQA